MDNLSLLISGYLDEELTDEGREQLSALLPADAKSLDQFSYASFIHYQLLDWMDRQRVQDRATSNVFADLDACGVGDVTLAPVATTPIAEPLGVPPVRGTTRMHTRLRSLGALAATILVAVSFSLLAYKIASRPVVVGQLTDATGSRWEGPQSKLSVGTLLHEGQEVALLEGSALITFVSGAQLLLEAPASLRLDSAKAVELNSGRIAAKVPTPARGFTVNSRLARFVDLGTEFTLKLDAEKSFELHVFEGLVELQLDERFGEAAKQPLRVAEVRAVSFDVESGDVAALHFQEGKKMPF